MVDYFNFFNKHFFNKILIITVQGRSISSQIEDAIIDIREQMPCGFESLGVGPLAPATISSKGLDVQRQSFGVEGEVHDFVLSGLNEFDILKCSANALTSKVKLSLRWNKIHALVQNYYMKSRIQQRGLTVNVVGDGVADVAIEGLQVDVDIKYKLGLLSRKIKLIDFKVKIILDNIDCDITGLLGDGFVNHKMNELIEEFVLMGINDNQQEITNTIEDTVKPLVNDFLDQHPLDDLIGGGGGSGEPKPKCVPPQH